MPSSSKYTHTPTPLQYDKGYLDKEFFNLQRALNAKASVLNLQVFANNAAALAGGLVADDLYRTATGVLMVVF